METKRKTIILFSLLFIFLFLNLDVSPAFATTIFSDGFESGDFSNWSGTTTSGGTITVESTDPYQGTYHAEANMNSGTSLRQAYCYKTGLNEGIFYMRQYVKFLDHLTSGTSDEIIVMYARGTAGVFQVGIKEANGRWAGNYRVGSTWTAWYSNPATYAELDTWYCVEAGWYKHGSEGWFKVWVDGNLIFEDTNIDTDNYGNITEVRNGVYRSYFPSTGYAHRVRIDCVVVADTYIGPISEEQEYSHTFIETLNTSTTLNQWQEHASTFMQTLTLTSTLNYGVETVYTFTTTINPFVTFQPIKVEAVYVFTQTITPSETVTYQQEHSYTFTQPLTLTEILNTAKELAETFVTNFETLTPKTIIIVVLPEGEVDWSMVAVGLALLAFVLAVTALAIKRD